MKFSSFALIALISMVSICCGSVVLGPHGEIVPPDADTTRPDSGSVADSSMTMPDTDTDVTPDVDATRPDSGTVADSSTSDTTPELPLGHPIVEWLASGRYPLIVGDNVIARMLIRSTGRAIAIRRFEISISVHPFNESLGLESWNWALRWRWNIDEVQLRRDGVLTGREVRLVDWEFLYTAFTRSIHVIFQREELIDTVGHLYTLTLPIRGELTSNDAIAVSLNPSSGHVYRGQLTPLDSYYGLYHWVGPHIYTGSGMCVLDRSEPANVQRADFVWSDRSSAHHTDAEADCTSHGSDDWFSGTDVQMGGGSDFIH